MLLGRKLSKVDKAKEYIGALKTYLGLISAFVMGIGAGVSKLYLENTISHLFYIGVIFIVLLSIGFVLILKHMHKKINDLEDL